MQREQISRIALYRKYQSPAVLYKYFPRGWKVSLLTKPVWAPPLSNSVYLRSELLKPLTTRGNENDNDDDSNDDDCTYLMALAHNNSGYNNVDDDEKQ